MIYLILDTNTWIYLANGADLSGKFHESAHFSLLEKLTQKIDDGSVEILITDVILEEWNRNKQTTNALIEKLKGRLRNAETVLGDIQEKLTGKIDIEILAVKREYKKYIEEQIALNEKHIEQVEKLLSSSVQFPITSNVKAFAADWSVAKKAPFTGKKSNSMADAYILFAAVEYIKTISAGDGIDEFPLDYAPLPIFVSANRDDFSSVANPDVIHDDLKSVLEEVKMSYYRLLPAALNFVEARLFEESEIQRIQHEMEVQYYTNTSLCEVCDPDNEYSVLNLVHFSKPYDIFNELEMLSHVQLNLEFNEMAEPKTAFVTTIQTGYCQYCSTEHVKCQGCQEITAITADKAEGFECESCGLYYKIDSKYIGSGMTEETISITPKPISS